MRMGSFGATSALALVTTLTAASVGTAAAGENGVRRFEIPAQPLTTGLSAFARAADFKLAYSASLARDRSTAGVSGEFTEEQALARLLRGSGLTYRVAGRTLTIEGVDPDTVMPVQQETTIALEEISVEGLGANSGGQSSQGYVVTHGTTGAKSDRPLIETPQSISVVTERQISDQGATDLADAVRYTPGITGEAFGIDTRGYGLQMRGFVVGGEAFFRDGLPQNGTDTGSFLSLDPYGADRYDILRGPSSVLYGQNTPGGVINYVSKKPTDFARGEVTLEAGNWDHLGAKFDVSGPANEEKTWLYRFVGSFRDAGTQVDHVDHDRYFFAPSVTYRPNEDTSLTILGVAQKDKAGWSTQFFPNQGMATDNINGKIKKARFIGEPDFDKFNTEMATIGYEFEHRFNDVWKIRQNARYSYLNVDSEQVYGFSLGPDQRTVQRDAGAVTTKLDAFAIDNQAQAEFETGLITHTAIFGLDYQRNDYDKTVDQYAAGPIDIFDPVYTGVTKIGRVVKGRNLIEQVGVYAQDQIKFGDFVATVGGRHDWADEKTEDRLNGGNTKKTDKEFSWRAGLVYLSPIGLAPYYSYSESFFPIAGLDAQGDAFKPEYGKQHELGVKWQPTGYNAFVTFSAFDVTRENLTAFDFTNFVVVQTAEVRSRGLELEAAAKFEAGWDLKFAYTYLHDVEITKESDLSVVGNRRYGTPKHRVGLWVDYAVPYGTLKGLSGGLGLRAVSNAWGDNQNTFKVGSAAFVDGAIRYDWGNYRVALNGTNVFDKRYTPCTGASQCFFAEGRKVIGSLTYKW